MDVVRSSGIPPAISLTATSDGVSTFHEAPNPFPIIDDDVETQEPSNLSVNSKAPSLISSSEASEGGVGSEGGLGRLMRRESEQDQSGGVGEMGDVEEFKPGSLEFEQGRLETGKVDGVIPERAGSNGSTASLGGGTTLGGSTTLSPAVWQEYAKAAGWGPKYTSKHTSGTYGYRRMPGRGASRQFNGLHAPANMDVQSSAQSGFKNNGLVKVKNVASDDETKSLIIREENAKCLLIRPVFECMHQYGSYGVNRLYTETYEDVVDMKWTQSAWMKDTRVQRKRIFDLTLPMTHASAAYDAAGSGFVVGEGVTASIITQTMDILQQLNLGVRALEIPVAIRLQDNEMWATWGLPNVPLSRVLKDIDEFLSQNPTEVIILAAKHATLLDDTVATLDSTLFYAGAGVLPGEKVHMKVAEKLEKYLALYDKMAMMSEPRQNPAVAELVRQRARVLYFWEGQQVLCLNYTTCQTTPGWEAPTGNYSKFTFGRPYTVGTRPVGSGRNGTIVIEPACIMPSRETTAAFRSNSLYKKLLAFINATSANETVATMDTPCWPMDGPGPGLHQPNLFIEADAYLILDEIQMAQKNNILSADKEVFTVGEPLTWRSGAERLNFNLLVWFFKKGNQPLFMRPNIISLDMVQPAIIQRITEANIGDKDCGIAMHCKDTGSCWSMTLRNQADGACLKEDDAVSDLTTHANDDIPTWSKVLIALGIIVFVMLWVGCCCCVCMFMKKGGGSKAGDAPAEEAAAYTEESPILDVAEDAGAESADAPAEEENLEF